MHQPTRARRYLTEDALPDHSSRGALFGTAAVLVALGAIAFFTVLSGVLGHQGLEWPMSRCGPGWSITAPRS